MGGVSNPVSEQSERINLTHYDYYRFQRLNCSAKQWIVAHVGLHVGGVPASVRH